MWLKWKTKSTELIVNPNNELIPQKGHGAFQQKKINMMRKASILVFVIFIFFMKGLSDLSYNETVQDEFCSIIM